MTGAQNLDDVPAFLAQRFNCSALAFLVLARGNAPQYRSPACARSGKQGPIPFALDPVAIWSLPESLALVGQLTSCPSLTPSFLTPLTRRFPAAQSALSNPQSAASNARRRTASRRRLMVPGARRRDSKCIRCRVTTVLMNESRGPDQYQSTNSSIACRQPR